MKCISKDDKIRTEGARSSPFSWKKNCRINSIIIIEVPGLELVLLAITARESFLQDEKDIRGFSFFLLVLRSIFHLLLQLMEYLPRWVGKTTVAAEEN